MTTIEISAALVKELREKTGVGLMECKKALSESNGDVEKAVTLLRERGLAKASKKSDRVANEGRVFIATSADQTQLAIAEINCETDFVGSNDGFKQFGETLANAILDQKLDSSAALESLNVNGQNFAAYHSEFVLKLGENLGVKQWAYIASNSPIASYIHMNGKIGVAVEFTGPVSTEIGKDIAMQVAANAPHCVRPEELDPALLESEKSIIRAQLQNEGKPAEMIEKILEGKIQKFYKDVCLLEQAYIKDDKKSIKQLLPQGSNIQKFIRFQLG